MPLHHTSVNVAANDSRVLMDTVGSTARRMKNMDLMKLIEELHAMLERSQYAVCSITRTDFPSSDLHFVRTLTQNMGLEEAISLLFQADIDQYMLTDISTQQVVSHTEDAFAYYINIRLARVL